MELTVATCSGQTEEEKLHVSSKETSRLIFLQVLPPYLLAGLGMVGAGMLLDHVQVRDGQIARKLMCVCKCSYTDICKHISLTELIEVMVE